MCTWNRCQNRIEKYYHNDGEQVGFKKEAHVKIQSKKKDVLLIFELEETKNSNLFDKSCELYSRERQMSYSTWKDWLGKLLLCASIS